MVHQWNLEDQQQGKQQHKQRAKQRQLLARKPLTKAHYLLQVPALLTNKYLSFKCFGEQLRWFVHRASFILVGSLLTQEILLLETIQRGRFYIFREIPQYLSRRIVHIPGVSCGNVTSFSSYRRAIVWTIFSYCLLQSHCIPSFILRQFLVRSIFYLFPLVKVRCQFNKPLRIQFDYLPHKFFCSVYELVIQYPAWHDVEKCWSWVQLYCLVVFYSMIASLFLQLCSVIEKSRRYAFSYCFVVVRWFWFDFHSF